MQAIIDIETNALELDEVVRVHCIVMYVVEEDKTYTYRPDKAMHTTSFLRKAKDITKWWGHNILAYDMPILSRLLGLEYNEDDVEDTLIYSRLLWSARPKHSLESWGKEFGLHKIEFNQFDIYSGDMLNYCINDVEITKLLYKTIIQERKKFSNFSIKLEHKTAAILERQKRDGFYFDVAEACNLERELSATVSNKLAEFHRELDPVLEVFIPKVNSEKHGFVSGTPSFKEIPFNPRSANQRAALLKGWWSPYIRTKTGKGWKMCEENLDTIKPNAPATVHKLAEWIKLDSRLIQLRTWIKSVGSDSRIHGDVFHIGCWSHRMSHSKPNTANIPGVLDKKGRPNVYGPEFRDLWRAEPSEIYDKNSKCIVGADAAGIQLRVLAHHINHPEFTARVVSDKSSGADIHTLNKRILAKYGCKTRAQAKTFIYAWLLGASSSMVSQILGCNKRDAQKAIDTFVSDTPGLKQFLRRVEANTRRGYMIGLDGRRVPIINGHLAKTAYLQSGEAIVMKLAYALWVKNVDERNIPVKLCGMIHDEFQCETQYRYANRVGKIIVDSIEEAGKILKLNVPMTGEYKFGQSWRYTH